MNIVYNPETGAMEKKWVHAGSDFREIDDALYFHERAYYRYCATGSGANPGEDQDWREERARLTSLWHAKSTYNTDVDPCAVKGAGIMHRILSFFK